MSPYDAGCLGTAHIQRSPAQQLGLDVVSGDPAGVYVSGMFEPTRQIRAALLRPSFRGFLGCSLSCCLPTSLSMPS